MSDGATDQDLVPESEDEVEEGAQNGLYECHANASNASSSGISAPSPSTGHGHASVRTRIPRRCQGTVRSIQYSPIISLHTCYNEQKANKNRQTNKQTLYVSNHLYCTPTQNTTSMTKQKKKWKQKLLFVEFSTPEWSSQNLYSGDFPKQARIKKKAGSSPKKSYCYSKTKNYYVILCSTSFWKKTNTS